MAQHKIVVDQSGHGDFVTIQSAINSLKDSNRASSLIFIRNGIYNEKIFIEKNNIVLEGESREKVIIIQSIARDEFRCNHADDWGVATVNVNGNDVTLKNLSVKNNYGVDAKEALVIDCDNDTILIKAEPKGPTCHTGNKTCFFNEMTLHGLTAVVSFTVQA